MSITNIVLAIVLVVGVLFFIQSLSTRKKTGPTKGQSQKGISRIPLEALSADDLEPTLTGKFRVEQMLQMAKQQKTPIEKKSQPQNDEDDSPLPDPFNK